MFEEFYKLAEQPFGVTPDPRYLYLSPTHAEAMASLMVGAAQNRGFTALIAHPGMGKTSLLFDFLERIHLSARTVFLFQTQLSPHELMRSLLADLGILHGGEDVAGMQLKLNDVLLREAGSGKKVVIVIDEAQALNEEVLEALRMLSNFETSREKLVHVVLAGQPQLAERLASPSMIQFRQRISMVARLTPFNAAETRAYIEHRLSIAGHNGWRPIFSDHAYALIAKHSQGIPRNINNLCFNALSVGCALGQRTIGPAVVYEVLRDLDLRPLAVGPPEVPPSEEIPLVAHLQLSKRFSGVFRKWLAIFIVLGILGAILCLPVPLAKGYAKVPCSANGSVQSDRSGLNEVSEQKTLCPSEARSKTRIRNWNGYLTHAIQELQRWNPWQLAPRASGQGQLLPRGAEKLPALQSSAEKTAVQLRPTLHRSSS